MGPRAVAMRHFRATHKVISRSLAPWISHYNTRLAGLGAIPTYARLGRTFTSTPWPLDSRRATATSPAAVNEGSSKPPQSEADATVVREWTTTRDTGEYRVSRSGTTLKITLTRPRNGNALTDEMLEGLTSLFQRLPSDTSVYQVVLCSEGKFFCTGMDLSGNTDTTNNSDESGYYSKVAALYEAMEQTPQTTIATVDGPCYGGGVGMAFACDVRIASPKASWTLSEVKIGVSPAIISKHMVREWGVPFAREAMISGREVLPGELLRTGAVHIISKSSEAVEEDLNKYLDQLDRCAPRAAATNKELVRQAWNAPESEEQQRLIERTFKNMMAPGSEGEHGIGQFRQKVKRFSWHSYWNGRAPYQSL